MRRFIFNEEFFKAEAEHIEEPTTSDSRLETFTALVLSAFMRERLRTASKEKKQPEAFGVAATRADSATVLADTIASESRIDLSSKQILLEILDPLERLQKLLAYLNALD